MNRYINILEIRQKNKKITQKKIENSDKNTSFNFNRTAIKKDCFNKIKSFFPLRQTIKIKSKYKKNNNPKSYLSPESKMKISYLNHFNNNSIYYSNNTKDGSSLYTKDTKLLNTQIKSVKNKLIFSAIKENTKQNFRNTIDLQRTNKRIFNRRLMEDSKNNDSIGYKKNNYILNCNFLNDYNSDPNLNRKYITTCKKPENEKKKLFKIISKKNLFKDEKCERKIYAPNNFYNININNNDVKTKIIKNPEKIIPEEFIKLKKIGEGSFGKIFKVKWIKNNKNYAMKEMHFQSGDNILSLQKKLKLLTDFENKTKCNGLIKIYGYTFTKRKNDYYFYEIMELAERDWQQEIYYRKKILKYYTEKELFSLTKDLVKALSLLQKNHITHRDIKLQNILLVNNIYKICDFGEARILNKKGIIVQPVRGSELYMSPILFSGLNQKLMQVTHNTYKSDIFSLGMCILFAATLGCDSLYEIREMDNINNIRSVLIKYLNKRYSNNFIEILSCMLEIKERKRPDFIQLEKMISLYEKINK